MAKESTLRKTIQKKLPMVHWTPIESGSTQQGIPDLNGCYKGREVWIELKQGRGVLSKWQINWAKARRDAGGRVFLMHDLGGPDKLLKVALWTPRTLQDHWFVKPWPWEQIRKLLFED